MGQKFAASITVLSGAKLRQERDMDSGQMTYWFEAGNGRMARLSQCEFQHLSDMRSVLHALG
jgi:hypothetical protein